jgi:hypothetical protein
MTGIWNPGVISYAMIPRCRPNSKVIFFPFIVTSIVYGVLWVVKFGNISWCKLVFDFGLVTHFVRF